MLELDLRRQWTLCTQHLFPSEVTADLLCCDLPYVRWLLTACFFPLYMCQIDFEAGCFVHKGSLDLCILHCLLKLKYHYQTAMETWRGGCTWKLKSIERAKSADEGGTENCHRSFIVHSQRVTWYLSGSSTLQKCHHPANQPPTHPPHPTVMVCPDPPPWTALHCTFSYARNRLELGISHYVAWDLLK